MHMIPSVREFKPQSPPHPPLLGFVVWESRATRLVDIIRNYFAECGLVHAD
ncbi:hypothetical protein RSAG8_03610, partial [Rhizoctonia solani AG-8 WAC10335]